LFATHIDDEEMRRAVCRAFNRYHADIFRDYADRVTPAACVPMHTPAEAIDELEYIAGLGLKVAMMAGFVRRPIPGLAKQARLARHLTWMDNLCLDGEYDYDPVWAKLRGAQDHADVPFVRTQLRHADINLEFHVQPDRPFRGRG
jgi:predicted TIM-barrel fold metal-dependent hydrolase